MKKTFTTLFLTVIISNSFAQSRPQDDTYGKSLMIQEQKPVIIKMPGQYLKKAGNNFAASIVVSILTGIAGTQIAKKNTKNANYAYIGGAAISLGLFLSGSNNLSKAGEEIDKVLRR